MSRSPVFRGFAGAILLGSAFTCAPLGAESIEQLDALSDTSADEASGITEAKQLASVVGVPVDPGSKRELYVRVRDELTFVPKTPLTIEHDAALSRAPRRSWQPIELRMIAWLHAMAGAAAPIQRRRLT